MSKKIDLNARKAFKDYKLEVSQEITMTKPQKNKSRDLDFSKDEYTHLGRS